MKKKAIEKIPYIGLRSVSKKKGAKYVGAAAVKIIGHEKHLITEVYRNRKEDLAVPVVRIVLTKKDFGTYIVESGEWSRRMLRGNYTEKLIWEKEDREHDIEKENVLRSDEDLKRIRNFTGVKEYPWMKLRWWEYIGRKMDTIAVEERLQRNRREYERRQQALKERKENTPELPEERILEYADRVVFRGKHYLYYRKHGVRARVACSKCGRVTERRWKPGISYESKFEPMVEEPREGYYGTCPFCRAEGEWKPQGKAKDSHSMRVRIFLGQKYKETGMVFRYIEAEKEYHLGLICEDQGTVMESAREKLRVTEIARTYFEEGKEAQTDYYKWDPYAVEHYWDDCNLYGLANISIKEGVVLEETYENMQGTFLQYSAMKEYAEDEGGCINPIAYAERYMEVPQIEMLTKLGLIRIVEQLVHNCYSIVADREANRVDTFLGIRKEHIRQLIRHQGEKEILRAMQAEKRLGQRWSDEQVEKMAEIRADASNRWTEALGHMKVQKLLNIIGKYAGCGYGTGCSRAEQRLRDVALEYIDYLNMRQVLGYDMSNTVYLMPRDLNVAHQKMVEEYNKEEADRRIREVQLEFPLIKKNYRRLRKKFYYRDGDFIIRPARDAGEIVMEGRILHHCVGGDGYLKKHNDDITTILFLRSVKEPDIPYITVEITTESMEIVQWYGACDKKPDEENMRRWLKTYVTKLKCGLTGVQDEAEEETRQQAAVPA